VKTHFIELRDWLDGRRGRVAFCGKGEKVPVTDVPRGVACRNTAAGY
jgi:hypothetical protein